MSFLNPFFLFGLVAIGIPIIIHLYNFRKYKKVYFTNVRFLQEVKLETRRKSNLKHLIVLILRILAIASLVIAFAQPYKPLKKQITNPKSLKYISIYIDNSFSMQSEGRKGTLLEEAKNKALEIASAYTSSDHFQLLTNDFAPKHRQFVSREEFYELVREVEFSPMQRSLADVARRQAENFSDVKNNSCQAYLISDFQKSTCFSEEFQPDTAIAYFLVPVSANSIANLYVDSCWFESPVHLIGQKAKLHISIKNYSNESVEKVPVRMFINKAQKAVNSFNIGPYGTENVVISYTDNEPGIYYGMIEIIDNPVIFDDRFYFSYQILPSIPILCINGNQPSIYLNSLLADDSAFTFRNVPIGQVDYNAFNTFNLIILNEVKEISSGLSQELQKYIRSGGHLLIIPPSELSLENYKQFLTSLGSNYFEPLIKIPQKISAINFQHPVYQDVFESIPQNMDMPQVSSYYGISRISRTAQDYLMRMQNGDVFLSVNHCEKGIVYLLSVPLQSNFSNFPKHALFVPTMYKIALLSRQNAPLYYTIGKDEAVEINLNEKKKDLVFKLKHYTKDIEIIPGVQNNMGRMMLLLHNQIKENGNYIILNEKDTVGGISFNYDKKESDLRCYTSSEIEKILDKQGIKNTRLVESSVKSLPQYISEINQGIKLWKIFVLLTLLFLAAEVLILRFWK